MTTKEDIIAEARKWIDTKFVHQGRSKAGIDCAGVCLRAVGDTVYNGQRIGITEYEKRPSPRLLHEQLRKYCTRIKKEEAVGGDIVVMQFENSATHIGFLTNDNTVIHGYIRAKKVVEDKLGPDFKGRIVAYYRVKGVE